MMEVPFLLASLVSACRCQNAGTCGNEAREPQEGERIVWLGCARFEESSRAEVRIAGLLQQLLGLVWNFQQIKSKCSACSVSRDAFSN
jgi:hypothetical protein